MSSGNIDKEALWERQGEVLRNPARVGGFLPSEAGLIPESLTVRANSGFVELLERLEITLLVTREYEHLVLALNVRRGKLKQSFMVLPHPSGLAVDQKGKCVYVAATRNPNAIWELGITNGMLSPRRVKYYPGRYYFHDLAFIDGQLFGNSVGQNGVVPIDMGTSEHEAVVWKPASIDVKHMDINYLQLNSIAAGKTLTDSYFSASVEKPGRFRPGSQRFKVDGAGVIFSGKTQTVWGRGLTRPHSARQYMGSVYVDNSGYGEFGIMRDGKFEPIIKLPGWTRGLMIREGIALVGVSRVLPRFTVYAPGLDPAKCESGIWAVEVKTGKVLGWLKWPYGNQIFAIDSLPNGVCSGFMQRKISP